MGSAPNSQPFLLDVSVQQERFAAAYQVLDRAIAARAFPGCAFGLLAQGQILACDGLGKQTYEPDSPAIRPDTVYDVASITKVAATTAVAMLLRQRGLLDLEMPLGDLLPGFVIGRNRLEQAHRVTLCHLLAHSSGLPGYRALFRSAQSPTALLRACLRLPIEAEPGTRAEYSDPGFLLLGKALETITGELLSPWLRRELYQQLGMTATGFCPQLAARPAIPPTEIDNTLRLRTIQGEVQDEHAWLLKGAAGHAGLFSNVPDLLRFAHAVLSAGSHESPFTRETMDHFCAKQPPEGSSRALGWDTPSRDSSSGNTFSPSSIGHLGYSGCSLWIDRKRELAVALLTNRTWPDRASQQIREVRPAFHDALCSSF